MSVNSGQKINVPDEVIIPNGDVVLVVGPQLRIQVSSQFLILASPVFDTMLSPKFSEGIKLHESNESPADIKLLGDDGLATAQALKTLHGSDPKMLFFDPDEIQKASIVVDKYDVLPRFAMAATDWMNCEPANLEEAWKLMTASYWLGHEVGFRGMSEHVVSKLNHTQMVRLANEIGLRHRFGLEARHGPPSPPPCTLTVHSASEGRVVPTMFQDFCGRSCGNAARTTKAIMIALLK